MEEEGDYGIKRLYEEISRAPDTVTQRREERARQRRAYRMTGENTPESQASLEQAQAQAEAVQRQLASYQAAPELDPAERARFLREIYSGTSQTPYIRPPEPQPFNFNPPTISLIAATNDLIANTEAQITDTEMQRANIGGGKRKVLQIEGPEKRLTVVPAAAPAVNATANAVSNELAAQADRLALVAESFAVQAQQQAAQVATSPNPVASNQAAEASNQAAQTLSNAAATVALLNQRADQLMRPTISATINNPAAPTRVTLTPDVPMGDTRQQKLPITMIDIPGMVWQNYGNPQAARGLPEPLAPLRQRYAPTVLGAPMLLTEPVIRPPAAANAPAGSIILTNRKLKNRGTRVSAVPPLSYLAPGPRPQSTILPFPATSISAPPAGKKIIYLISSEPRIHSNSSNGFLQHRTHCSKS